MILGLRWPLIVAALGSALILCLVILGRGTLMEWSLFLPIPGIAFVLLAGATFHAVRKRRIIALYDNGAGDAPAVPHLFGKRYTRAFLIGATRTVYEVPYLYFDPPLAVMGHQPIDRLFVDPRFTCGGLGRIEAFTAYANSIADARSEGEEP